MKPPLFRLFLVLGMCGSAAAAQQSEPLGASGMAVPSMSAAEQAVWEQEEAYWRFAKSGDQDAYRKLWDDSFTGWPQVEPTPLNKSGLSSQPIKDRKILDYRLEPLSVRQHGDKLVITFYRVTTRSTDRNDGDERIRSARLTHTWMKSTGSWKIVAGMSSENGSNPQSFQLQSGANVEEEIARVDDERRNAYLQNDAATLERILTDDVTAMSGIGSEDDKAAILADVKSHDLTYKKLTYDHRKIRIYGDTAVVTSHVEVIAKYKDRDLTGKLLGTRVYAKQQGTWKLVAIQSTRIPESVSTAAQDATYQATAEDTSKVVFVPAKQLDSEIHKAPEQRPGISWIDFADTPKYSATIIRRTAPDRAEVHKAVTDIWYMIEGGGTLVTGGSLTEVSQTEPDELRGRSISGGEERQIGRGDFVKIPDGVPHWVQRIDGKELVYLVVKVASPESMKPEEASSAEAELRAVLAELHKAALEGDSEKTVNLMTDEYVQTDISGHFQEKTEWLNTYSKPLADLIKAGKFHWEVYDEKDVQIRIYGDAAVVMGTFELKGAGARWGELHTWVADPDAHPSATLRFTRVFIRRNGKWLLAALHNALLLPPPPPANK